MLTLAECSETVRRTLEAVAELAGERRGGAGEDLVRRAAALLSAPKGYEDYESYDFEYGEYADNGYAADILEVHGNLGNIHALRIGKGPVVLSKGSRPGIKPAVQ